MDDELAVAVSLVYTAIAEFMSTSSGSDLEGGWKDEAHSKAARNYADLCPALA